MANDVIFKKKSIGGFDPADVMDYIGKMKLKEKQSDEKIASLTTEAARLAKENAEAKETIEQLKAGTQPAEQDVSAYTEEIASLKSQLSRLEESNAELEKKNNALAGNTSELAEKDKVIESLRAELAEKDKVNESLKAELAEKSAQPGNDAEISGLKAEISEKNEAIANLTLQLNEKNTVIANLNGELEALKASSSQKTESSIDDNTVSDLMSAVLELKTQMVTLKDSQPQKQSVNEQIGETIVDIRKFADGVLEEARSQLSSINSDALNMAEEAERAYSLARTSVQMLSDTIANSLSQAMARLDDLDSHAKSMIASLPKDIDYPIDIE